MEGEKPKMNDSSSSTRSTPATPASSPDPDPLDLVRAARATLLAALANVGQLSRARRFVVHGCAADALAALDMALEECAQLP